MGSQLWDLYRCSSVPVKWLVRNVNHSRLWISVEPGRRSPSREWELSVLTAGAGGDKQSERVRSLFHRQLQVPLAQGPAAVAAYKEWEDGGKVG